MNTSVKQEFVRRITQANRSQLTVIVFEMLMEYLNDTKEAKEANDCPVFREGIRKAIGCVDELLSSLNYDFEISQGLSQLYMYVKKELILADIRNNTENFEVIYTVIKGLHESFEKVSKEDTSPPLMQNTQDVYAGLTYGRNDLNESLSYQHTARGYQA